MPSGRKFFIERPAGTDTAVNIRMPGNSGSYIAVFRVRSFGIKRNRLVLITGKIISRRNNG
ncbi:MAG TPA: hypothetical protein DC049_03395 [Spirochaetia bacterium]|nr:hypothetical protein [Spirochaetia bacterium]